MAKRKKGLSIEEKQEKMLQIFLQTKDVMKFPEIEKLSLKAGIAFATIKEVLEILVAENKVLNEKIGAGQFYWSFPSQNLKVLENQKNKLVLENAEKNQKIVEIRQKIEFQNNNTIEDNERQEIKNKYEKLNKQHKELQDKIHNLKQYGSTKFLQIEKQYKQNLENYNNYVDGIFALKKWIKERDPSIQEDELNKNFEIPEELDYIQQLIKLKFFILK